MKKLFLFILLLHIIPITHAMSDAAEVSQEKSTADLLKTLRNLRGDHNREKRKALTVQLIEKDPSNVDVIGYLNFTPLGESITHGDLPFVRYLLQHNADVNKKYKGHHIPLSEAAIKWSLIFKHEKPIISSKKIAQQKKIIKLLVFFNGHADLSSFHVVDEVRTFVKQTQRKKAIREYLFIITHITQGPGFIVANYLKEDFQQPSVQELTEIDVQVEDELPILEID